MKCDKTIAQVKYRWRPYFLGPQHELVDVDIWTLVPKDEFLNQPCVLTRPQIPGEIVAASGNAKGKGKGLGGKGLNTIKGTGEPNAAAASRAGSSEKTRPTTNKAARHLY